MIHLSQLEHDALKGHQVGANRLAAVLTTSTCTRSACTSNCAYPFCFDKQPVSERAALQVDLDILAGKLDGRFQARRDERAIREQQQRLGQTFGGGL